MVVVWTLKWAVPGSDSFLWFKVTPRPGQVWASLGGAGACFPGGPALPLGAGTHRERGPASSYWPAQRCGGAGDRGASPPPQGTCLVRCWLPYCHAPHVALRGFIRVLPSLLPRLAQPGPAQAEQC